MAIFQTPHDFLNILQRLPGANKAWREQAQERQQSLTKPPGSLGRLEELAIFLAGWGRGAAPVADKITTLIFAGNHGVTKHNISPYPSSVTFQMVQNFAKKGAAINAITQSVGVDLNVIPIHLDIPTADITTHPALTHDQMLEALNIGAEAVPSDLDVLCLGEMGIGNTTIASALSAATFGGPASSWAGAGTGLDEAGIAHKTLIIDRALERYHGHTSDTKNSAFDILQHLGGRETAALVGAVLAARLKSIPVVLDGFVVCASVAPLLLAHKGGLDHCLSGHLSAEAAHAKLLQHMRLYPLLQLDMRLGEGTGAALAAGVLRCAVATHNGMATFAEANIDNRENRT
ncbi:MAG: nicotinate-nucleotide--dimethylbenzimidazole phosphoribosyltransferase [Pseudomonadota bacterium]